MIQGLLAIFLIIDTGFSFMAGLMSFLITYQEYSHHFKEKKKIIKLSLQAGFVSFFIILMTSLIAEYILINFVINK